MLVAGTVFDGRYVIDSYIGVGGQAHIYKALDQKLQRVVALKLMRSDIVLSEEDRQRFYREAQAIAQLEHPSILRCYHMGIVDNQIYTCLEYMEAPDLAKLLTVEKLPWQRALDVCANVCEGMAYAHGQGVLHRDLTPRNILVFEGRVKIIDFGLASLTAASDQKLTATGNIVGTPLYISPELWQGKPASERSDIYSVGCMLYQCVTGEVPFNGSTTLTIGHEHVQNAVPRIELPGAPAETATGLNAIVRKAMAKNQKGRYQSMQEMRNDLMDVQNGRTPHFAGSEKRRELRKIGAMAAGVIILSGAVAIGVMALSGHRTTPANNRSAGNSTPVNVDSTKRKGDSIAPGALPPVERWADPVGHRADPRGSSGDAMHNPDAGALGTGRTAAPRDELTQLQLAETYALQHRLTESNSILTTLLSGSTMNTQERGRAVIDAAGNNPRVWKTRIVKEFPGSQEELFFALHETLRAQFLAKHYVRTIDFASVLSELPADTQRTQELQIHGRIYMGQALMELKDIDGGTLVARTLIDDLENHYKLVSKPFRKERLHLTWGLIGGYPAAKLP